MGSPGRSEGAPSLTSDVPEKATPELQPAFGGFLRGTEGIRGSLCVLIVWYHVYLYSSPDGPPTTGAPYTWGLSRWQLGLSVFFMLSAFLLYRPFVQSIMLGRKRPAFGAYLANRVLRIMPVYWVILGAAAIAGTTIVWVPTHDIDFHLPTFLANLGLVHGLHPSGMQTGVPPSWSLAVEWGFYLVLPLLVMLALRIGGRSPSIVRRRWAVAVPALILLVVGILGREAARRSETAADPSGVLNTWHAVIAKSFPTWADLFALGMLVAILRVEMEAGRLRLPSWWRPAALVGWLGLSLPLIALQQDGALNWYHYNALVGVPLALFLSAVVLFDGDHRRDGLMRVLEWKPFVRLGEMSLSIYLIHYPVIVFLLQRGAFVDGTTYEGMAVNWLIGLAVVLPLSYLTHRFVEVPAMKRKIRTKAEGPPPPETEQAPAPGTVLEPAGAR